MTISSQIRTAGPFLGNGAQTVFPFVFKVFEASDVAVQIRYASLTTAELALSSDYTVALNTDQNVSPGGFVTKTTPLLTGETLTFTSDMSAVQPMALTNAGGFYPRNIEDAFDRLTILIQQLGGTGVLRVPEIGVLPLLPSAALRANRLLGWDADGNPLALVQADASGATALDLALRNGGSSFVTFLQAGAGALLRTLEAKLRETSVSVVEFGAVGDWNGTTGTDNTAAFIAALAYAQGTSAPETYGSFSPGLGSGRLFIPDGAYRVSAALVITKRVHITGDTAAEYSTGARIYQTSANTDLFRIEPIASGMSVSFEKVTLSSTLALSGGSGQLINVTRTTANCNSQRYLGVVFANAQDHCLKIIGDDVLLEGCLVDVSVKSIQLGTAVAAETATNVRIRGCDFYQVGNSTTALIDALNVDNLTVTGNTSFTTGGLKTGAVLDARTVTPFQAKNIAISGNTFQNARSLIYANNVSGLAVSGNVCTLMGVGAGETRSLVDLVGSCAAISVTGNSISGSMDTKHVYDDSMAVAVAGLEIVGNTFANTGGTGTAINLVVATQANVCTNSFGGYVRNITAPDYLAVGLHLDGMVLQAYSVSITPDTSFGSLFSITPTDGAAFAINVPTATSVGQKFAIQIRNGLGGPLGVVTWNASYKMTAWTQPANGFSRTIWFLNTGSALVEIARTAADVPN